jgi:hypothetical protein
MDRSALENQLPLSIRYRFVNIKRRSNMQKPVVLTGLFLVMLFTITGCAPGTTFHINTPAPTAQTGVPVPNGQINVPGITVQLYAPGPNPLTNTPDSQSRVAGILTGVWQGIISPFTLIGSVINPSIQMYEVHNDGAPYNLGYLLGVAIVFAFLGAYAGSRRRM